jgi:uncharacterized membrane protein YhhN
MYLLLIPCVVLYMRFKFGKRGVFATIFKGLATWVILAGALFSVQGTVVSMFSALIIAGLAMGLAGDIALSLPNPGFTSGTLFFGLGHVCYIIAMIFITGNILYPILAFVLLYSVCLFLYRKSGVDTPKDLRIPLLGYSILISCMISFAFTMPLTVFPKGLILVYAGLLFVASDIMLAYGIFPSDKAQQAGKKSESKLGIISLTCYFLAQSLFAVSAFMW